MNSNSLSVGRILNCKKSIWQSVRVRMLVNSNFSICENLHTNNILLKYLFGFIFWSLVFFLYLSVSSSFCLLLSHESYSLERIKEDFICLYLLETNLAQGDRDLAQCLSCLLFCLTTWIHCHFWPCILKGYYLYWDAFML